MNEECPETMKMTPLDQMLSSEPLQLLKAAVPYAPPAVQKILSVWAKMQELRYAMKLFPPASGLQAMSTDSPQTSFADMLSDISQFASGETRANLENISSVLTAVQMFQTMQQENEMERED